MRRDGFGAVVMVIVDVVVAIEGFLFSGLEAARFCLEELSSLCAVVTSRLRSEMSGSSGLGQREDVEMVLRLQS